MLVVLSQESISCAGLMRPAHTRFSEVPLVHLLGLAYPKIRLPSSNLFLYFGTRLYFLPLIEYNIIMNYILAY
ncbi:hypothetical protein CMV_019181 [Castanea mollissima]|uniref:Uncharacterized protein n=1 Tax=Castanea mollissima TaxID=60419 RepID=A0A8J4QSX9_9ROSI|nr:hypothetical protein CMV_019181 [Castanea mollissima]